MTGGNTDHYTTAALGEPAAANLMGSRGGWVGEGARGEGGRGCTPRMEWWHGQAVDMTPAGLRVGGAGQPVAPAAAGAARRFQVCSVAAGDTCAPQPAARARPFALRGRVGRRGRALSQGSPRGGGSASSMLQRPLARRAQSAWQFKVCAVTQAAHVRRRARPVPAPRQAMRSSAAGN